LSGADPGIKAAGLTSHYVEKLHQEAAPVARLFAALPGFPPGIFFMKQCFRCTTA
jgi:hypothetical protein